MGEGLEEGCGRFWRGGCVGGGHEGLVGLGGWWGLRWCGRGKGGDG